MSRTPLFLLLAMLGVACSAAPAEGDGAMGSASAAGKAATPCCEAVTKHVKANYGQVGGLDECVDDAEAFCAGSERDRACCAQAASILQNADEIRRATARQGCEVDARVATRMEQCARYRLAETLCDLPAEQAASCTKDVRANTPERYEELYTSQHCQEPHLMGVWDVMAVADTSRGTPPNCHGTAAAIHGIDLEHHALDRTKWKDARGASALPDDCEGRDPDVASLTVEGFTVNMEHGDTSPDARARCGEPMYTVTGCAPRPRAVLWLHGMTRQCFQEDLRSAGLRPVDRTYPVVPGCVLTYSDHSLTVVERAGAMCRIYEKTTPYGANWYRWLPCCDLMRRFDSIYCPAP